MTFENRIEKLYIYFLFILRYIFYFEIIIYLYFISYYNLVISSIYYLI